MNPWRQGGAQPGPPVTFSVNGRPCRAFSGQSLAAALLANGYEAFGRSLRSAEPRGLFCGMGTCFGCLVTVDGRPDQRACQVEVRAGLEVVLDEA